MYLFKVHTPDPETSEQVQEAFFLLGFYWQDGRGRRQRVQYTDTKYLFVTKDKRLLYSDEPSAFYKCPSPELDISTLTFT